jgi:hypothetical protein
MKALTLCCLSLFLIAASGARANDSVCAKWKSFGAPAEIKKCYDEQEAARDFISAWLEKYGVKSPRQLLNAVRQGKLFALLYQECTMQDVGTEGEDLTTLASCLKYHEAQEKSAGTDLTKGARD